MIMIQINNNNNNNLNILLWPKLETDKNQGFISLELKQVS